MSKPYNHINYKNTELGWIPSDWKLKILNDIGVFTKGKGISKDEVTDNGKFPSIRYADIYTTYNYYTENLKYYIDEKSALESYKISKGDILFAGSGETVDEIGKSIVYFGEGDAYAGGDIIVLRQKSENSLFLGYLFNSSKIKKQLIKLGQGNSVVHIYSSSLKKLKLALPPLPEQQKIAQILSTWDKAIAQQEQLIAQKRQLKKGMMQQLLTAKLRFPGFEGEWEMVKLGEIGFIYSGLTGKSKNDFGKGKPYIPYLNIFNNFFINENYFDLVKITENEIQNRVKYGDIFFTVSSETSNEVGMSSVILFENDELYLNSFCFGFRLNNFDIIIPEFATFYLRGNKYRSEMKKAAQGATRYNLSKERILKSRVFFPTTLEQKKISNYLKLLYSEIETLQTQLTHLQTQKQGLMQVLLTGEIRVKV